MRAKAILIQNAPYYMACGHMKPKAEDSPNRGNKTLDVLNDNAARFSAPKRHGLRLKNKAALSKILRRPGE